MLGPASGLAALRGQGNYNVENTYEYALARHRQLYNAKVEAYSLLAFREADGVLAELNTWPSARVLTYGALAPTNSTAKHVVLYLRSTIPHHCDVFRRLKARIA
ncbi:234e78e9-1e84-4b4e-8885-aec9293017fb-CDS [Sclerotinia trifoliorum]|uniref:234e78e9-1e84-4b4e-8885-aec9293017fb-CDS n=1 Tax=Sclerotinia trifoliorum TaxID=28548 RepID=A0A8H2VVZ5_9HELO|nr:234e78e9-1e84-4b4e-8885-aec9293017fb-CDS [Sclerotinia trifoliorum]